MAVKVIARAPFGHSVTIQNTSTALMATNARPPLMSAGSQSGTCSVMRRGDNDELDPPQAAPVHREQPRSRQAGWRRTPQAAERRRAGRVRSQGAGCRCTHSARFPLGFSVQVVVWAASAADRSSRAGCWAGFIRLLPSHIFWQARKSHHRAAPGRERVEESMDGALQQRGMIAKSRELSERLVRDGVKRDHPPDELASNRLQSIGGQTRQCQARAEPLCDFRLPLPRTAPPNGAAHRQIGPGEHNAGGRDSDPDLAHAIDGEHECLAIRAAVAPS